MKESQPRMGDVVDSIAVDVEKPWPRAEDDETSRKLSSDASLPSNRSCGMSLRKRSQESPERRCSHGSMCIAAEAQIWLPHLPLTAAGPRLDSGSRG